VLVLYMTRHDIALYCSVICTHLASSVLCTDSKILWICHYNRWTFSN